MQIWGELADQKAKFLLARMNRMRPYYNESEAAYELRLLKVERELCTWEAISHLAEVASEQPWMEPDCCVKAMELGRRLGVSLDPGSVHAE